MRVTKRSSSTPVGVISSCSCIFRTILVSGLRTIAVMSVMIPSTIRKKMIVMAVWILTRSDNLAEACSRSWLDERISACVQRFTFSRMRSL